MDDWQQQLWKRMEQTATEIEEFLVDVEQATESLVEEVNERVGSFLEEFSFNLVTEVDQFIDNLVDVIITTSDEIDAAIAEDWQDFVDDDFTVVDFHNPSLQNNPACINCVNYHGQSYNGNLLVCGMHPHGWDGDRCPDWESET